MIDKLVQAGMDVARLNFSHGTNEDRKRLVTFVRRASKKHQRPIAVLADLQGPKIRTGTLANSQPAFTCASARNSPSPPKPIVGDETGVSTTFKQLPRSPSRKGDRILLSDGQIALRVLSRAAPKWSTRVENGGRLGQHQGINLPGAKLKIPSLTPKDRKDLLSALEIGANYIALSFVRTAGDVKAAKAAIARAGKNVPVIAKLEKPEAIDNLDAILAVADGVMVARGDLGVEMNPEQVPVIQKKIISKARERADPRDHRHPDARIRWRKIRAPRAPKRQTLPTPSSTAATRLCFPARPPPASIPSKPSR